MGPFDRRLVDYASPTSHPSANNPPFCLTKLIFMIEPSSDNIPPQPPNNKSWFDIFVTEFAFLRELGFDVPEPNGGERESMGGYLEFKSPTTIVSVMVDRGTVSIDVGNNDPVVIHRERVSLWAILREKCIDPQQIFKPRDPADGLDIWQLAARRIAEGARAMEAYCGDVLDGDFRIFPAAEEAEKQWFASLNIKQPGQ